MSQVITQTIFSTNDDVAPLTPDQIVGILSDHDVESLARARREFPHWIPQLPPPRIDVDLRRHDLSHMDLRGMDFSGLDLTGANFSHARLAGANLAGCNMRGAKLIGASLDGVNFIGTKGLFGSNHARFGSHDEEIGAGTESITFRKPGDHLSWSILRSITTLRVFGASYLLIVLLVAYAGLIEFINDTAYKLASAFPVTGGYTQSIRNLLISQVPLVEVAPHFGVQILMVLFLAIGATIYEFFCPELIKENSESRWTRELNQSLIEYRAADASYSWARTAAFLFYGTGGLYTLVYGSLKVVHAVLYFFGLLGII